MYTQLLIPLSSLLLLSSYLPTPSHALQDCLLLGSKFPAPQKPSRDPSITAAKFSLAQRLQKSLQNSSNSFSIDVFSTNEADSIFTYHQSAPSVLNSTAGVKKVDANTVYRVGSISKLFTVLVFLVGAGDAHWNDPITRYIPELLAPNKTQISQSYNPVGQVSWSAVTVGALASHMAGIGREHAYQDLSAAKNTAQYGFPSGNIPPCGVSSLCDRKAFFDGFLNRHPVVATFSTPIYSNIAFQLIAYALETISQRPFKDLFQDNLVKALNLTRTSLTKPSNDIGIIGEANNAISWTLDAGDETPAGGAYSSSSDLSVIGRAILKSTLLSPAQTRRWMKPLSHTSSPSLSIGAPWEIYRTSVGHNPIDLYTKGGDLGVYSSMLVLIPDYEIGFSVLVAGKTEPGSLRTQLSDVVSKTFLPALDSAARSEAETAYSGRFIAGSSLNSSLILSTDKAKAGLVVTNWISNGTDIIQALNTMSRTPSGPPNTEPKNVNVRLLPNNLRSPRSSNGTQEIGFRATFEDTAAANQTGIFSGACSTWGTMDHYVFAGVALDDFTITVVDGKAVEVFPRMLQARLRKS